MELDARITAPAEWRRGDPAADLLASGRLLTVEVAGEVRFILVDAAARYAAAFAAGGVLTSEAARREIVVRYAALASPFTVDDVVVPSREGHRQGLVYDNDEGERERDGRYFERTT